MVVVVADHLLPIIQIILWLLPAVVVAQVISSILVRMLPSQPPVPLVAAVEQVAVAVTAARVRVRQAVEA